MIILPRSWLAVIGALVLGTLPAACGNQKEGERCDLRNFNADCDDGLTCTQITGAQTYQVCCYQNNAMVTNPAPACIQGTASVGGTGDASIDIAAEAADENATGPDDAGATE